MIKLKPKVNKSELLRTSRQEAERIYKYSWKPELLIGGFMDGVKYALGLLQLPPKENSCPICNGRGTLFYIVNDVDVGEELCYNCNGKKVIEDSYYIKEIGLRKYPSSIVPMKPK